jgi:hypothetical protein
LKDLGDHSVGSDAVALDFPLIQYPRAFTLMAQYPLHTHIVFSINRSLGGEGRPAQDRFQTLSAFLDKELAAVQENDRAGRLASLIREATLTRKRQKVAFKKAATLPDDRPAAKVCLLRQVLSNPTDAEDKETDLLADRSVFNEMRHITGEVWTSPAEVTAYLEAQGCTLEAGSAACSCPVDAEAAGGGA